MEATIARFERHSGLATIADVSRPMLVQFRDAIQKESGYASGTVNKKIGYILSMSKVAAHASWIEDDLGGNYYLDTPADEDRREPYTREQEATIFGQPLFTGGRLPKTRKALGAFSFWFPPISVLHGLITSEVGQLGPDTIVPHPDEPEIFVFDVTTAGGRTVKTLARRRVVPVRRELIELGLMDLAAFARREGWRTLWPEAEAVGWPRASNYFSAFWTRFADEIGVASEGTSLYSLRHSFQDAINRSALNGPVKELMGHAETGMSGRSGSKTGTRAVAIVELEQAIQKVSWPWLAAVRAPPT
jgi:integrase